MIDSIIRQYADDFGVLEVLYLEQVTPGIKTSFSWSNKPNSLCLAMNKKYFRQAMENENIRAIIASPAAFESKNNLYEKTVVIAEKADEFFYFLHNNILHTHQDIKRKLDMSIAATAHIAPTAILEDNVSVGENVTIGHGCVLYANTVIGENTILHPNVTIGTEGFFSKNILGKKTHIKHYGGVILGKHCIVHTGSNISRSVNYNENTILADNVHVGIHSSIGHDCQVAAGTDISAKVMLAGRVRVGKNCWLGAGVVVSNAIKIGDGASVKIGAVVIEDVPAGQEVSGNFAIRHAANLRNHLKEKRS